MFDRKKQGFVPLGLRRLDKELGGGLPFGHLVGVTSSAAGGKTTFLIHVAEKVLELGKTTEGGPSIAVMSPENMPNGQVSGPWKRLAANEIGFYNEPFSTRRMKPARDVDEMEGWFDHLLERFDVLLFDDLHVLLSSVAGPPAPLGFMFMSRVVVGLARQATKRGNLIVVTNQVRNPPRSPMDDGPTRMGPAQVSEWESIQTPGEARVHPMIYTRDPGELSIESLGVVQLVLRKSVPPENLLTNSA